ncbi:MAG: hypothetical protein BWY63_03826 [Chloroflexi bacterium ADurb.Bin360]|nr:MAG: hypothetical protein BWY63_03826 [Chloroflexi bacterium ADurb.Bin360]
MALPTGWLNNTPSLPVSSNLWLSLTKWILCVTMGQEPTNWQSSIDPL